MRKIRIIFSIVIFFFIIQPTYSQDVKAYVENGKNKIDFSDYNGAIKDFDKAIDVDPTNALAFFLRAKCKHEIDDFNGALYDYTQALKYDRENVQIKLQRIKTYFELEEYNKISLEYTLLLKSDSTNADFYFERGKAYLLKGLKTLAIKDFDYAKEYGYTGHELYEQRGYAQYLMYNYFKAYKDLKEVIENTKIFYVEVYAECLTKLIRDRKSGGQILYETGKLSEKFSNSSKLHLYSGIATSTFSNITKKDGGEMKFAGLDAIKDFNKAIELEANCDECYYQRANCLFLHKDELMIYKKNSAGTYATGRYKNNGILDTEKNTLTLYEISDIIREDLNKAIEINPDNWLARILRVELDGGITGYKDADYLVKKFPKKSYYYYMRAIRLWPNIKESSSLGISNPEKQIYEDCKKAIELGEDSGLKWMNKRIKKYEKKYM